MVLDGMVLDDMEIDEVWKEREGSMWRLYKSFSVIDLCRCSCSHLTYESPNFLINTYR